MNTLNLIAELYNLRQLIQQAIFLSNVKLERNIRNTVKTYGMFITMDTLYLILSCSRSSCSLFIK